MAPILLYVLFNKFNLKSNVRKLPDPDITLQLKHVKKRGVIKLYPVFAEFHAPLIITQSNIIGFQT